MSFLISFDYIYYRVAAYYENHFSNEDKWNAISILSIIQSANLLTLISVVFISLDIKIELSPFILLLLGTLVCFGFNIFRYNKIRKFKDLEFLWGSEKEIDKTIKGVYIIIYFLISIVLIVLKMNTNLK